jgi:hypothetical protein
MRPQYHFRRRGDDLLIWSVARLVALPADLPRHHVPLAGIRELEEPYWFSDGETIPTCRAIIEHARLIAEVDATFPIILSSDGGVMDGMHRVARAVLDRKNEIQAVRFPEDPVLDYVNRRPSELPY